MHYPVYYKHHVDMKHMTSEGQMQITLETEGEQVLKILI